MADRLRNGRGRSLTPRPGARSAIATERPPRKLTALRNIGARTASWLAEVDIRDEADLRALGAVAAYRRLKHARPRGVTLVALYAAYGALTDTHWNEIPEEIKAALRREAEESRGSARRSGQKSSG